MAMNPTTLAAAILVKLKALYRNEPPEEFANDDDYFLTQYVKVFADEIVQHIQANAKCSGTDSGGDSHANVEIV